jgi:hypothetical protein
VRENAFVPNTRHILLCVEFIVVEIESDFRLFVRVYFFNRAGEREKNDEQRERRYFYKLYTQISSPFSLESQAEPRAPPELGRGQAPCTPLIFLFSPCGENKKIKKGPGD